MKYFSKYPVFFTLLILLLAAFVGIVAYDIYLFGANSKASSRENSNRSSFVAAVKNDPGKQEVEEAQKNIEALRARLDLLDKDLSRESSSILAPLPANLEGYQLTERIRSMVQQWKLEAEQKGVGIPSGDYAFSFKRYLDAGAKAPVEEAVAPLWKQASILDNIMKKFFAAKENTELNIISVQREILPTEAEEEKAAAAAAGRRSATRTTRVIRSNTGDTFEMDPFISARKTGNIKTLGYKIVFTGYTDTMRRFLNNLNNYDLMLVVRSIEVKPTVAGLSKAKLPAVVDPAIDFAAALEAAEGDAAAANAKPEVVRDPVVSENLSEFTVVIEFVEVDKDAPKPAKSAEETENADAKEAQ